MSESGFEPVLFNDGESREILFNLDPNTETIWATQAEMGALFGRDIRTIGQHLDAIFKDGELERNSVIRKLRRTAKDGKVYKTLHYNLDVILSVGYRVSSAKATKFRQWATQVLRSYIVDGYALNEARLADAPASLRKLAGRIRALRAQEKNVYEAVRTCFKLASVDYSANAQATRKFYATLQNKFLYATVGQTSAEIILSRADHKVVDMGLKSKSGVLPTIADATVGKNYLDEDELYALHILCEQFLLFAESRALKGQSLTMNEMSAKFDELLAVQGHPIFREYKQALRKRAVQHAKTELGQYKQIHKFIEQSKKAAKKAVKLKKAIRAA